MVFSKICYYFKITPPLVIYCWYLIMWLAVYVNIIESSYNTHTPAQKSSVLKSSIHTIIGTHTRIIIIQLIRVYLLDRSSAQHPIRSGSKGENLRIIWDLSECRTRRISTKCSDLIFISIACTRYTPTR